LPFWPFAQISALFRAFFFIGAFQVSGFQKKNQENFIQKFAESEIGTTFVKIKTLKNYENFKSMSGFFNHDLHDPSFMFCLPFQYFQNSGNSRYAYLRNFLYFLLPHSMD